MLFLQIGLFLLGGWMLSRRRLRFGGSEIPAPFTTFAGLMLVLQLPLAMGAGVALGGATSVKALRTGDDPAVSTDKFAKKFWWLDLAMTGGALAVAGSIGFLGLRPVVHLPPPPDEAIGIRDLRNQLIDLEVPWEGPEALPRNPNEPLTEMAIRESRRSSIRTM